MAKAPAKKKRSKTEILNCIAEATDLSKKQVQAVFDTLAEEIKNDLGKKGTGEFTLPGLCKFTVKRKPATKERKGINPFTGEETIFKAKPARNDVKIRPLKALRDSV
jgi:nucleoid DNA-binding protein